MSTQSRAGGAHRLLVLDTSYSLEFIRNNKLEASVTCRSLGGYFEQVWTVHPFASLVTSPHWGPTHGPPTATVLAPGQTFLEGKIGRFDGLAAAARLNFALAQAEVLTHVLRLVRTEKIDLVRVGDPLLMGLYGVAISRLCRIPLVVRLGGNYERNRQKSGQPLMPRFFPSPNVEREVERFVLGRAHLVAGANQDYLDYAIAMGTPAERTTLFRFGNLIDPVHLTAPDARRGGTELLEPLGLHARDFLLYVGRLEKVKMSDHPIRALALVRAAGLDAALLLVGGGAYASELKELARDLGVANHVVFAGNRDQVWLANVIPRAAVVLSPATGRALCEVAFGAAPVVAYDFDWQAELIVPEQTGQLVPFGDIQAMADATVGLLRDRGHARDLGGQLRSAALEMLDPARLDAHERDQYDRVYEHFRRSGRL